MVAPTMNLIKAVHQVPAHRGHDIQECEGHAIQEDQERPITTIVAEDADGAGLKRLAPHGEAVNIWRSTLHMSFDD